jgi:putative cytosolic protein
MRKKKWLSILVVCAIFLSVLQGVVFAETVAPNIVAHYTFDEGNDGWWLYGNGSATLGRERVAPNSSDYCLVAYERPDAWTSPAIDIYQLIKAAGPGTYTVHATVKTDSTYGGRTRILLRSNKENSFIKDQGTDYHMWLSVGPKMERNAWKNLSGSFKILPSDISESTGQLVLCFDSLVNQTPSALYISDVIICKLSNTGATNGTFEYGTVGWRNWGGEGTLDVGTQYKFGNLIPIGHYLKASTYGSIACNVDQILSNYGKIKYQVDFDLYLASYSLEAIDKLQFYLSKGEYQYHYLIQQKGQSELVHGWQHISLEIDTSIAPYYSPGSDILYDLLQPNTREVFFRIQYDPVSGAEEQDEEYGITNFTFRPKTQANYVPSQKLNLSNTTLELTPGQSYQLTATLLPSNATYKGIEWKTTNGYYVGVNQYGLVTAHGRPGTSAVITAQSEDGVCMARCTVTVVTVQTKYLKQNFGFDTRVCNILGDIQNALISKFPSNLAHADYMYNRIISGFQYINGNFDTVGGNPYSGTNEQSYITGQLGISLADYKYVRYHVRLQHALSSEPERWSLSEIIRKRNNGDSRDYNNCITHYREAVNTNATEQEFETAWVDIYDRYYNKGDFAHQFYTTSVLLHRGTSASDEHLKDLAGWLGDTSLDAGGEYPLLNADDYYADLDAENIVYFMQQNNWNFKTAFEDYYSKIGISYNRAEIFLRHTSIETIKSKTASALFINSSEIENAPNNNNNDVVACYNLITNLRNNNNEFVVYKEAETD